MSDLTNATNNTGTVPVQEVPLGASVSPNKYKGLNLIVLLLVLLLPVAAYAGFAFGKNTELSGPIPTPSVSTLPTEVITQTIEKEPYFGWKTYTSSKLKLSFKYPQEFTVSEEADGIVISSVLRDKYQNHEDRTDPLVTISKTEGYMGDVPQKLSSSDPQSVTIMGRSYGFKKAFTGEGGPGYDNEQSYYSTKVGNFYIVLQTGFDIMHNKGCEILTEPERTDCKQEKPAEYRTPQSDIDKAMLLIGSLEF